jgi:hypothetical protein
MAHVGEPHYLVVAPDGEICQPDKKGFWGKD